MPCGPVDAMNPIKVAEAVDEAIQRARRGDGPTFLEMKTYTDTEVIQCLMHNTTEQKTK